ncbi:MAG: hypothetical protein KAR79_00470 [Simkaniaceae bacterium]|nr:hypothetical protein [Simkaniaceae bacterium]
MRAETEYENLKQIYYGRNHILTCNSDEEISYIYSFNPVGRIFRFIKNLFSGSEDERLQQAVLETLTRVRAYQNTHTASCTFTVVDRNSSEGQSTIGMDALMVQIISDEYNLPIGPYPRENRPDSPLIQIREIAMQILTFSNAVRLEADVSYDTNNVEF